MPVSKKRKTTKHIQLKNQFRGYGYRLRALNETLALLPQEELNNIIQWAVHASRLFKPSFGYAPSKFSQIDAIPSTDTLPLEKEFAITCAILEANKKRLKNYVNLKNEIEDLLETQNFADCIPIIDTINNDICASLTGLNLRISLTGLAYGLEAQKSWISSHSLDNGITTINFFAYWFGVRSEKTQNPERFKEDVVSKVIQHSADKHTDIFLRYYLTAPKIEADTAASILSYKTTFSFVDLYEACVKFLQTLTASQDPKVEKFKKRILCIMSEASDLRHAKLSTYPPLLPSAEAKPTSFQSELSTRIEKCLSVPQEELAALCAELKRYAFCLDNTRFGSWCDATAECLEAPLKAGNHTYHELRYLNSSHRENGQSLHQAQAVDDASDLSTVAAFYSNNYTFTEKDKTNLFHSLTQTHAITISLMQSQKVVNCCQLISDHYLRDKRIIHWLPLQHLHVALTDQTIGSHGGKIEVAIVAWLVMEHYRKDFRGSVQYAAELYLQQHGVAHPSELIIEKDSVSVKDIFFLDNICSDEILSESLEYPSEQERQDERIRILFKLQKLNPDSAEKYADEITAILREQELQGALKTLQLSKINFDEEPLRSWAHTKLKDKFNRFHALIDAGLPPHNEDLKVEIAASREPPADNKNQYSIPTNEAASLFTDIIHELTRECSLNAKHGINSYLSLRLRHGTISGQLRRPAQEQNLLTTSDSSGQYSNNRYWFEKLMPQTNPSTANAIAEHLAHFSEIYDDVVNNFTSEFIQVRTDLKPQGIIDPLFTETMVISFASDTYHNKDFDKFLDGFFQLFWLQVQFSLKNGREIIRAHLHSQFDEIFELISSLLNQTQNNNETSSLRDALTHARSGLNDSISELVSWLDIPQEVDTHILYPKQLIEIGCEMVKRLHPTFKPNLQIDDDTNTKLANALILFTDALFILFENVQKHSGLNNPNVTIRLEVDGHRIKIYFESECKSPQHHTQKIDEARKKVFENNYSGEISSEGGTGFPKLAKVMEHQSSGKLVDFGINIDKSAFFANLEIHYMANEVIQEEE